MDRLTPQIEHRLKLHAQLAMRKQPVEQDGEIADLGLYERKHGAKCGKDARFYPTHITV